MYRPLILLFSFLFILVFSACGNTIIERDEAGPAPPSPPTQSTPPSASAPAPAYIRYTEIIGIQDGWIYFYSIDENGEKYGDGLYRMRPDGAGKTKILDKEGISNFSRQHFTFDKDWIYFTDATDSYNLYKMRTDGTEITRLVDDGCISVSAISDGWIYYDVNSSADNRLYKIRIDGTDQGIVSEFDVWIIDVIDGWIYYQEYDEDLLCLFKMQTDGTEINKIASDLMAFAIEDGWIYCRSPLDLDGYQLHKLRLDGTEKILLDDFTVYNNEGIFISDNRIYYNFHTGSEYAIRIVDINTMQKTDLKCDDAFYIFAVEDAWIYYQSESIKNIEGDVNDWYEIQGVIYRLRTDGSEKQEIVFW